MSREVKEPEVRRQELIDIAQRLFLEKGYEETPVSEIVRAANVAQGTFYYYFKSKDEVLDAIIDMIIDEVVIRVAQVASRIDLDAAGKIIHLSAYFSTMGKGREKLIDYIHQERNAHIHLKVEKRIYPRIVPYYAEIIREGVDAGQFDTHYPEKAALALFAIGSALGGEYHDHTGNVRQLSDSIQPVLDMSERILGAESGTFMRYIENMEVWK